MIAKKLHGKEVERAEIDGYGITMKFTDGTIFVYDASDGGYSSWHITSKTEEEESEGEDNDT